jgi:hypothetical protein
MMLDPDDYYLTPEVPVLVEAYGVTWQFTWGEIEDDVRSGFARLVAIYWGKS